MFEKKQKESHWKSQTYLLNLQCFVEANSKGDTEINGHRIKIHDFT